jgi:4-coumarate--CoA ligase
MPRAYIVLKEGSCLSENDILRFMEAKVSKIKTLSGGIVFTGTIPKTPVSPLVLSRSSTSSAELRN